MTTFKHKVEVWLDYLNTATYGDTFGDRFSLFWYTLKTPFYPLMKKYNIKTSHVLSKNITLNLGPYKLYCGNYISTVFMASPNFEPFMKQHIEKKEGTFIDVGSNIGKYAIRQAAQKEFKGKVLAIEPEADNFIKLRKNIIINNLQDKIIAVPVACGEVVSFLPLHLDEPTQGSGVHSMKVKRNYFTQQTPVYPLDYLVAFYELPNVTLIKIDVEGAELDVLKGATRILTEHKPKIIFEAWHEDEAQAIENYLEQFGYKTKPVANGDGENYIATYGGKG